MIVANNFVRPCLGLTALRSGARARRLDARAATGAISGCRAGATMGVASTESPFCRFTTDAMHKLHTDREILRCLHDMYVADYPSKGDPFIQIDMGQVASQLRCAPELLYGRLYFDMGTRLRHRDPRDPSLTLASVYEKVAGSQRNVINFPYVVSLLAGMEFENRRNRAAVVLSVIALSYRLPASGCSTLLRGDRSLPGTCPSGSAKAMS